MNLAGVTFVDSGALGWLVSQRSTIVAEGGQLKLLKINDRISDLLITTRLELIFDTFESEDEATKSFA